MADNNFFFKVLAELSDTEYFTFLFYFPLTGGGGGQALSRKFLYFFYFFLKPCLSKPPAAARMSAEYPPQHKPLGRPVLYKSRLHNL